MKKFASHFARDGAIVPAKQPHEAGRCRTLEERDEWTARVLGRFQLAWANIERDIHTLWLMRVGENEFRRQDTQTLQERRKRLPRQNFQKLVKCTVPGGNLHTWLLDNWPTRNLVIHGCLGQKIDFSKPSVPFIADADDMAMMQAAEPGDETGFSREWIDVDDLVPLTEEARQVKSCLMQVHMMVLQNGVGRFPLRDPARPPASGRQRK